MPAQHMSPTRPTSVSTAYWFKGPDPGSGGWIFGSEQHERPLAVAGGVGGDGPKDEVPDHALSMMQEQHALCLNFLCFLADVWPNIHGHVHRFCMRTAIQGIRSWRCDQATDPTGMKAHTIQ